MSDLISKCEVCNSLIDEEDLFCANCGTEAPKREEREGAVADSARVARHNFAGVAFMHIRSEHTLSGS